MNLVLQHPHPLACQQACYAMLAGCTLEQVIAIVGHDRQMAVKEGQRVAANFAIKINAWTSFFVGYFPVEPVKSLKALMKEHRTLLCSVHDVRDASHAHSVVIHNGDLYDPSAGMNPSWPWSRVISNAHPVDLSTAEAGRERSHGVRG